MITPAILARISEAIAGVQYGQVHITIHNARVVQIDKIEKIRLADRTPGGPAPTPSDDGVDRVHRA